MGGVNLDPCHGDLLLRTSWEGIKSPRQGNPGQVPRKKFGVLSTPPAGGGRGQLGKKVHSKKRKTAGFYLTGRKKRKWSGEKKALITGVSQTI